MSDGAPWVLGVSTPHHNAAACLLKGDEIVVAVQEERLNRRKRSTVGRDWTTSLCVDYCLKHAGITLRELDLAVVCGIDKAPCEYRLPSLAAPVLTISHHLGHAIGVFATSGFEDAVILVADGNGQPLAELPGDATGEIKLCSFPDTLSGVLREVVTIYEASGIECVPLEKHVGIVVDFHQDRRMPDFGSLGGIFNAAAQQIFGDLMECGKVMGLAPYGRPRLGTEDFFSIDRDGRFHFRDAVPTRFVQEERWPHHPEAYEDLAFGAQEALERGLRHLVRRCRELSSNTRFCYAGGVALNSVANQKVVYKEDFDSIYIMPATEDSGGAIGAAYYGLWKLTGRNGRSMLKVDSMGKTYSDFEIASAIASTPHVERVEPKEQMIDAVVDLLCDGAVVGWFMGGSELGPRALGHRSILCDPRRPDAKRLLNERVKHREGFRPFAPVILREELDRWFEVDGGSAESPFMLRIFRFKPGAEEKVPAVAHVDHTGRVQTVSRADNGLFYELVERFHQRTGVPIILNTSFNVMGEPIVETPEDALWCLLYTGVDACVLGRSIVRKAAGYRSVLDLIPRVSLSGLTATFAGGRPTPIALSLADATEIEVEHRSRWGRVSTRLSGDPVRVLAAIDGVKSGWALIGAVGLEERRMITALGALRRASCIAFDR